MCQSGSFKHEILRRRKNDFSFRYFTGTIVKHAKQKVQTLENLQLNLS
jgi:hypothetical protein